MPVMCGHCHNPHATLQEVRDCSLLGHRSDQSDFDALVAQLVPEEPTITERQLGYLQSLVTERPQWAEAEGVKVDELHTLTKSSASALIAHALAVPKEVQTKEGSGAAEDLGVAPGYYAIPSATGNNDLDFYAVKAGKNKWSGRVFVDRVIGGRPDRGLRASEGIKALKRIKEFGTDEAGLLYAQQLGRCRACNRHLTDETSRELGIGPECRKRQG